jgi:hypothetical protein
MWQYNYLAHYASEYYDPVKAHQYYEEHKQLKGRTRKGSLTEEGKKINDYVKANINSERNSKLEAEKARYQNVQRLKANAASRTMEQHRTIMNQRINSIQNMLKRMSPERRKAEAPKLKHLIYQLKEDNKKKRESIQAQYKGEAMSAAQEHANANLNIRTEAKEKYEAEYDKILSEHRKARKRK